MKHRIVLVSDMHYSTEETHKEMRLLHPDVDTSLAAGPAFGYKQREKVDRILRDILEENGKGALDAVLVLGDLSIDDYNARNLPDNYCLKFKHEVMDQLPCPSYAIAGNHDSYPSEMWETFFGYGRQFSVKIGDAVFVMLDTFRTCPAKDASGSPYTPVDMDFLNVELAKYPTEKIFLCAHCFAAGAESEEFRKTVTENDRIVCLFQGHTHCEAVLDLYGKTLIDIGGYAYSMQVFDKRITFNWFDRKWAWGYEVMEWEDGGAFRFYHVTPHIRYSAENGEFDIPYAVTGEVTL